MTVTVKHGDTHDTVWTVNMDLTGATVRLLARPKAKSGLPDTVIELASTVTDAPNGQITHSLTGTLDVGDYDVEAEVTAAGEITTFPNCGYGTLQVKPDLG